MPKYKIAFEVKNMSGGPKLVPPLQCVVEIDDDHSDNPLQVMEQFDAASIIVRRAIMLAVADKLDPDDLYPAHLADAKRKAKEDRVARGEPAKPPLVWGGVQTGDAVAIDP